VVDKQKTVVIVGGGTAGWICASVLSKGLPKDKFNISLIESPDIPTVGVGEATIPPIINLLSYLEINELDFVRKVQATFKYGIHFEGWHTKNTSYMHAFGLVGCPFDNKPFTELWLQYRDSLNLPSLNAFSPTALSAYSKKFNPPHTLPKESDPQAYYPLSGLFYAYHFDASLLADTLKTNAINSGVNFIQDTVETVNLNSNGDIDSVSLKNADNIKAELFIDCTGSHALLSKQTLQVPYVSFKEYLPCNSAIAVQTQSNIAPLPYTKSIAMNAGWRWKIPLQHRQGNGYVYASDFTSDEQALIEFKQSLRSEEQLNQAKVIKFDTGYCQTPWFRNCIAIGLSSGFFEPLESTSIHMTQKHVFALKDALLNDDLHLKKVQQSFNHDYKNDSEDIRDFLLMHYCTTKRNDTEFWRYCQSISLPDSLSTKLDEYHASGQITLAKNAIFPYQSWLQVLTGQKVFPAMLSKQNMLFSDKEAMEFFQFVNNAIGQQVRSLPSHEDYLTQLIL
jgi:tryptophan halogenase